MIPKIIHFIDERPLDGVRGQCVATARRLHPDWDIKVWTDRSECEEGLLGGYLDKANSGAQVADLMRLELIYKYGGVYIDTDVRLFRSLSCLTSFDKLVVVAGQSYGITDGAFMAAPPRHPAVRALIDYVKANEPDWSLPPNETTGPYLFSLVLRGRQDVFVLPSDCIFFHGSQSAKCGEGPHRLALGEHLGLASWRSPSSYRTDRRFSPRRFVRRVRKKIRKRMIRALVDIWAEMKLRSGAVQPLGIPRLMRTKWGAWIWVGPHEVSMWWLGHSGSYDPREEKFLDRVLRPGDWFVDVGANWGVYTTLAAHKVGPFGRVFAFEPNPVVRDGLKRTVRLNSFHDRVVLREEAVMGREGTAVLTASLESTGGGRVCSDTDVGVHKKKEAVLGREMERWSVRTVPLNTIIPSWIPVRAIKIDVEGNEAQVLHGAKEGLEAGQFDYIIVEVIPHRDIEGWKDIRECLEWLGELGYRPVGLSKQGRTKALASLTEALKQRASLNLIFEFAR